MRRHFSLLSRLPPRFSFSSSSFLLRPPQGSGDDLSSWKVTEIHVYAIQEPWTKQFNDPDGMQNLVQPADAADPAPLVAADAASRAVLEREHSQVIRITISIFISRLSLYFALQSILPVALCTLLSLVCFWLGASRVCTPLELTFSLFLTLAALSFVIVEELPRTSAVLPSQTLVLVGYSFLFVVAAESLVVYHVEIFPELRAEWRRRAAARAAAKRELSQAVSSTGKKLVNSVSSLGRGKSLGSPPLSAATSAAAVAAAAANDTARRRSKDAAAAREPFCSSSLSSSSSLPPPPATSSASSPPTSTRKELRPLRSLRFSSDIELGPPSSSSAKKNRTKKDDDDEKEEDRAAGSKVASAASASAVARGDHAGGEHRDGEPPWRSSLRREKDEEGYRGEPDIFEPAERDKYRYAAFCIDRASFWLLLCSYVAAAVLIFALSSALAPGDCAQFAQQSLIDECRLARKTAEARKRLGGGVGIVESG